MNRTEFNRRSGFTLTEILVVAIIIGILMSLVSTAVFSGIKTAKVNAVSQEISKMEIGFKLLDSDLGGKGPPPADLRNPDNAGSPIYKFVRRAFPFYNAGNLQADLDAEKVNYTDFDPGYSLVFWLVGFSGDQAAPFRGHGRRMGIDPNYEADLDNSYYEFIPEQMALGHYFPPHSKSDLDRYYTHTDDGGGNSGIWDAGEEFDGSNAYLYFSNDTYTGLEDNDPDSPAVGKTVVYEDFMPYRKKAVAPTEIVYTGTGAWSRKQIADRDPHYNNDTFQIISSGLDQELGDGGRPPGDDEPYYAADGDNIANFTGGSTLGDFTDR